MSIGMVCRRDDRRDVGHASQGVWMLLAKHPLPRPHDLSFQYLSPNPSPPVLVCRCEVGHAGQSVWVLLAKHPLSRLHDPHIQFPSLHPPSPASVCRCEVGHASQGSWMLLAEYPQIRFITFCSGPTVDPGRLGMARTNCSWPGIYSWPGCGGPTGDLQLAWLWMARHPQLARADCGS